MHLLDNPIRHYAWGSTHQMAQFLGHEPSGRPEAELWLGAHPAEPSHLPDGRALDELIAADPVGLLGARVRERFGDRLPFLMKVLAVAEPLSLQVHPSAEQARIGHELETIEGKALDDPTRNYVDPWHKPELVFALTRFVGLAGFRPIARTVELLGLLHVPWADRVAARLQEGPEDEALHAVTAEILHLQGRRLTTILREVGDSARHAGARAHRQEQRHRSTHKTDLLPEAARAFATLGDLARRYPKDPGVLVTLLLNNVVLAPGEAMFVDAGVIHAYVEGFGVEIMASSDNVLRAGLTPKHCDVEELLRITDFSPIPPPRWAPAEKVRHFQRLEPPVTEFALSVGELPLRRTPTSGPWIVLVLEGEIELVSRTARLELGRGRSAFVDDTDGEVELTGTGRVAIGAVPT